MGLAVTPQTMIDAARRMTKADTLDQANAFVTDDELLEIANVELAELEDTIRASEDDEYQAGIHPITLAKDQTLYALPIEAYKVTSVDIQWQPGVKRSVRRFNEADRNRFQSTQPAWSHFGRVYFRPRGQNIEILPAPQSAVTIYVNYSAVFTPLDLEEPYDSQNLWHMAAVYGLAVYIAMADSDLEKASFWEAKKQGQLARVREMASSRVTGEPPTIQRVRHRAEWED